MTIRISIISIVVLVVLSVLTNGCLVPPILCPKAGGYGVVVDQDGKPLAGVRGEAQWLPGSLIPFVADAESAPVPIDSDGRWEFYKRKVERLTIAFYAPPGYEPWKQAIFSIYPGHCVSNVVIQFRKKNELKEAK